MIPYLIFETANFHGGNPNTLVTLIQRLASLDSVHRPGLKFHPIAADYLASPSYPAYALYQQLEIQPDRWREIIALASRHFDVWLEMADSRCAAVFMENQDKVKGVKLQASMLENEEVQGLLRSLNLSQKQLIANVSGFEMGEIEQIASRLIDVGFSVSNTILQIGFQSYPTAIEDSQLNKISVLRAAFPNYRLGIADHLSATDPYALVLPSIACALGCTLIEKHTCLSREETQFDAFSALEPEELLVMQRYMDATVRSFSPTFNSLAEKTYLEKSRFLPCCAREKREGSLVGASDVIYRRQGGEPLSMAQIRFYQGNFQILAASHKRGDSFQVTSFRKAHVAAVVACRMKSSRLRDKALLPLAGKPMIERCIENCQKIRHADSVFLATSTHEQDAVLESAAKNTGCGFYRGDPDDVMVRYLDLARAHKIDIIVRVTGDNPVISPEIANYLLTEHFRTGADFTRADNDAVGTGAHVINVEAMWRVVESLGGAPMSEYMNWYFENNSEIFKVNIVDLPDFLTRNYRLTMDYKEDYELFVNLFEILSALKLPHTLENVFYVLDNNPKLAKMNMEMLVRYHSDENLIKKLKVETRLHPVVSENFSQAEQDL